MTLGERNRVSMRPDPAITSHPRAHHERQLKLCLRSLGATPRDEPLGTRNGRRPSTPGEGADGQEAPKANP